jgi:hypothetical protein
MGAIPRLRAAPTLPGPVRALILLAVVVLTAVGLVAMHSAISEGPVVASSAAAHDHGGMAHDAGGAPADAPEHHELLLMGCVLGMLLLTILFALQMTRHGHTPPGPTRAWAKSVVALHPRRLKPSLDLLCISRT